MKTKLSNLLIGLQAAAALCVLGAVKIWAPVCGKMLDLANGNQVPMKCHWAGQAAVALSVVLLVCALVALLAKRDHRKLMIVSAVTAVMIFLTFTGLIGVCASETMRCQSTALWGKIAAVVALVDALAELLSGKEGQIPG